MPPAEGFGQEVGQGLLEVETARQSVAQREEAAGDDQERGHHVESARHHVRHGEANVDGLGDASGAFELGAANFFGHRCAGRDFAEEERGGEIVGEVQAAIDDLCDGIRGGQAPLDAERPNGGGKQGEEQRDLPAQNLSSEQQEQDEERQARYCAAFAPWARSSLPKMRRLA